MTIFVCFDNDNILFDRNIQIYTFMNEFISDIEEMYIAQIKTLVVY